MLFFMCSKKYNFISNVTQCEKCPYSEFFWSLFSVRMREKLEIRILFTQCQTNMFLKHASVLNRILLNKGVVTAQKMKFSIKNFLSKCYQICSFLRIWSHLLKESLMENFISYTVCISCLLVFLLNITSLKLFSTSSISYYSYIIP